MFESGKPYSLLELVKPQLPEPGETKTVHFDFSADPLSMDVRGIPISQLRCLGFDAELSFNTITETSEVGLAQYVKYHIQDVLADEVPFLGPDGGPPTHRG